MPMKAAHSCRSIIVHCIDFRIQKFLTSWVEDLKDGYDRLSIAGGVKDLPFVLEQLEVSHRLHHIKEVYLINHEDCGAYGKQGSAGTHIRDLLKAQKEIVEKYPGLKVILYYLKLNGSFEPVD